MKKTNPTTPIGENEAAVQETLLEAKTPPCLFVKSEGLNRQTARVAQLSGSGVEAARGRRRRDLREESWCDVRKSLDLYLNEVWTGI